jgi:hypothetical protein
VWVVAHFLLLVHFPFHLLILAFLHLVLEHLYICNCAQDSIAIVAVEVVKIGIGGWGCVG